MQLDTGNIWLLYKSCFLKKLPKTENTAKCISVWSTRIQHYTVSFSVRNPNPPIPKKEKEKKRKKENGSPCFGSSTLFANLSTHSSPPPPFPFLKPSLPHQLPSQFPGKAFPPNPPLPLHLRNHFLPFPPLPLQKTQTHPPTPRR